MVVGEETERGQIVYIRQRGTLTIRTNLHPTLHALLPGLHSCSINTHVREIKFIKQYRKVARLPPADAPTVAPSLLHLYTLLQFMPSQPLANVSHMSQRACGQGQRRRSCQSAT